MKKTILVTGATGSLGKIICCELALNGNNLILAARNAEKLSSLQKELSNFPVTIEWCNFDFTDSNSFSKFPALTSQGLHGVIIMPPQPQPTSEILPESDIWENLFKSSFIGPACLLKKILPSLLGNHSSKIVLISGISSIQPIGQYSTSSVIRTAWLGLVKTLADKHGREGLRINTLSIGGVMTDIFNQKLSQESKEKGKPIKEILQEKVSNVPLRKYATVEEISNMVNFLINSVASDHLTGQNIVLDGGFTRRY